jgi:SAM-dependent methyltransferase
MGETPLMYGQLAAWFHLLTPPGDYAGEAAEVETLLSEHTHGTLRTILELGSGGGNLASHLSARYKMTLVDPAPGMLALSETINPTAEHLLDDMRTARLGRVFDAVLIHDAIVYMADEADLRAALATASVHLRPGGAALFLPDWVLDTYQPETESGGNDEDGRGLRYLEWDRPVEPDGHTVRTDYVIVLREGDEVTLHHDVHTLGIFDRATWLRLLKDVGLEPLRVEVNEGHDAFIGRRPR